MTDPAPATRKKVPILTIIALVILILGALFSFGGSLIMLFSSLVNIAFQSPLLGESNIFSTLSATTMLAVFGLCTVPGIVFLSQKLSPAYQPKPHDEEDPFAEMPFSRMMLPNIALALTVLLLVMTYLLSTRWEAARWVLPFLQVPAVLVPTFWLVQFATRKIYPRPAKRHWIAFGLDLTLQPLLALTAELALMMVLIIPVVFYLALNPEIAQQAIFALQGLEDNIITMDQMEIEIAQWIQYPFVIILIQVFVSVLVPLVEELIKPFLLFRWFKRPLTPMDGFWLGLIGGASFAIYETFGNIANMFLLEDWYFLLLARVGTSLLHLGTTALMGWALMKTFADRKWLRLLGIYAASVLLHGLWNFFAIIQGFSQLPMENPPQIFILSPIAMPIMLLVGVICTGIILLGAALIQKNQPPSPQKLPETSETA
jgi:hypothetical protein